MVIAVDLTSLAYHITGIERYALCTTEKLLQNDRDNEYILIFKDEIYESFRQFIDETRIRTCILKGRSKILLFQWILPMALYRIKADRYLFLAFPGPILFRRKGIFSTIHDMGAWDAAYAFGGLQRIYCRITTTCGAANAEEVITVSEFSKGRISKILNCSPDKIHVIYSGVTEKICISEKSFEDVKAAYHLPDKYVLALSTLEPKKNLDFLLKAYSNIAEKVDYDLVLAGRAGWKTEDVLEKYSGRNNIHLIGFVEDEGLAPIYRQALCFIFPSKYEGFGLPPVEALSFGTPVIASDAASIPEVLMEQARYFTINETDELEEMLLNLDKIVEGLPRELNEKQKKEYNFDTAAEKILEIMEGKYQTFFY